MKPITVRMILTSGDGDKNRLKAIYANVNCVHTREQLRASTGKIAGTKEAKPKTGCYFGWLKMPPSIQGTSDARFEVVQKWVPGHWAKMIYERASE